MAPMLKRSINVTGVLRAEVGYFSRKPRVYNFYLNFSVDCVIVPRFIYSVRNLFVVSLTGLLLTSGFVYAVQYL